jgi:hypothetical protein
MTLKRPKTLRETVAGNHAAMDFLADMHGVPRTEKVLTFAPKREYAPRKASVGAKEADVLRAVLDLCRKHPAVGWCRRMSVGQVDLGGGNRLPFGFVGCSDIIGQMKDGRFMALEVKREIGGHATEAQLKFIYTVRGFGGVAGVCRSAEEAQIILQGEQR